MTDKPDYDTDHAQRIAAAAHAYVALTVKPHDGPGYRYRHELMAAFYDLAQAVGLPVDPGAAATLITHVTLTDETGRAVSPVVGRGTEE